MIAQNLKDADNNPLSTTVDTVSVTEVPFPAITTHPGQFSSKNALSKRLFDHKPLDRYSEEDSLRNNTKFLELWNNALRYRYSTSHRSN